MTHGTWETTWLTRLLVYYEGYWRIQMHQQPDEGTHRGGSEQRVSKELLPQHGGTWKHPSPPTQKIPDPLLVGFYGGFFARAWLNHWPLAIELSLQSLSSPLPRGCAGWDWKFQPSNYQVGPTHFPLTPAPKVLTKNSGGFESCDPFRSVDEEWIHMRSVFWSSEWPNMGFL